MEVTQNTQPATPGPRFTRRLASIFGYTTLISTSILLMTVFLGLAFAPVNQLDAQLASLTFFFLAYCVIHPIWFAFLIWILLRILAWSFK